VILAWAVNGHLIFGAILAEQRPCKTSAAGRASGARRSEGGV